MTVKCTSTVTAAAKGADGTMAVTLSDGSTINGVDCLLAATGRKPLLEPLNLAASGVKLGAKGTIEVDEYQRTNVEGVCAPLPSALKAHAMPKRPHTAEPTARATHTDTHTDSHPDLALLAAGMRWVT